MRELKFFQTLLVLGTGLCLIGIFFYFRGNPIQSFPDSPKEGLLVQNYMGPIKPIPGKPNLVRVEILVKDSPDLGGVQIKNVTFNGESVPLKPRDIIGNRGSTGFQVPPGKYKLIWTVQRDKVVWPRTITHEEEVTVDPRDLWIQIAIEGEKVSIL